MAFGFFRRHQKAVIVIMVVLMVAFLLTSATLSSIMDLFSPSRNPSIGTLYGQKVTQRDLQEFRDALILLGKPEMKQRLGWAKAFQADITGMSGTPSVYPSAIDMLMEIEKNGHRSAETLALLYREAVHAGVTVSEQEIINAYWMLVPENLMEPSDEVPNKRVFRQFVEMFKVGEDSLRRAMVTWLTVNKNFNANLPRVAPSAPELRQFYSTIFDKIDLRLVRFPVEPALERNPTVEEVREQFEKFRTTVPGLATKENPFGFGYKMPNQVGLQWLMIRDAYVAAAVTPSKQQIEQEFILNANTTYKGKELWEVQDAIAAALVGKNTEARIAQLMESVVKAIKATHQTWNGTGNFYDAVVASMKGDAGALLSRKVSVDLQAVPLKQALRALAEQARVDAIVFPMNTPTLTISDSVVVTLQAQDITLGEALARVTVFVLPATAPEKPQTAEDPGFSPVVTLPAVIPTIQWCNLRGMDNVLFACNEDDLNTFPLQVGQTDRPLTADEIRGPGGPRELRFAYTSEQGQSRSLADEVAMAKPFTPVGTDAATGAMEVGQDGPMMYVLLPLDYTMQRAMTVGRLFWRLTEAMPAHSLTDEEFADDVMTHIRVIADWRLLRGYERAKSQAQLLAERADRDSLASVARMSQLATEDTGGFTRMELRDQQLGPSSIPGVWQMLPPLAVPMTADLHQQIMDQAFAMAPKGEPPYSREGAVGMIEIPPAKLILVAERKRFEPGVESEYQIDRMMLASKFMQRASSVKNGWFHYNTIVKRTGFDAVPDHERRQAAPREQPMQMDLGF